MIAQADKELGDRITKFTYRVVTNNEKLERAIKSHPTIQKDFDLEIIFERGKK